LNEEGSAVAVASGMVGQENAREVQTAFFHRNKRNRIG